MHFERLKYSYDKMGNISAIFKNGTLIVKYTYIARKRYKNIEDLLVVAKAKGRA